MELEQNGIAFGSTRPLRVIIIGGGFSGTLAAIHLLRQNGFVHIDIVDQRLPGRGLAYSTFCDEHLLNVPAIRMSAFGSEPHHFLNWLRGHGMPLADPDLFAPRRLYGSYVQDLLERTTSSAGPHVKMQHHVSTAIRVGFDGASAKVFLQNGAVLKADKIILALGNPASRGLRQPPEGYYASPWQPDALSGIDTEKKILLLGAGLTAVDAFLALTAQGHTGEIHMVSRRGQLPRAHEPYRPLPDSFAIPAHLSARSLLKAIRAEVGKAQTQGVNWRAVIDSLRPVTNEIWQRLSLKEQSRIFRHLKTWWDIHRHRMAPDIGKKVQSGLQRKQLIVHAGRLRSLTRTGTGLQAEVRMKTGLQSSLLVEKVINCMGPDSDYQKAEDALTRSLLEKGYGLPGKTGKGFQTSVHGEMIAADGRPLPWLFTLGTPRLGDLLETTAVPELRRQSEALANHLLSVDREPIEVQPEVFLAAGI